MRAVLGIVLGYVIFAGSAVALFQGMRLDPHAPAGAGFMAFTVIYGVLFAAAGGWVAGAIGRRRDTRCGLVLAVIIGMGALSSIVATPGASHWTQFAAILLMAPAGWFGDRLRRKPLLRQQVDSGRRA
jgi:ABC-type Mn2+/Zn2+ transport system permease subunit